MSFGRHRQLPHRREREPGEFASVVLDKPRARMARPDDRPQAFTPVVVAAVIPRESPTSAGNAYMGRVASLGCALCRLRGLGATPAEVHHVREGQGASQRASAFLTVPLCPACHRGARGIHGDRSLLRQAKVTELDLLADTIHLLQGHA
jgi:hypothetical protein